jgi:2,3-diketo-5-methylthio-1-phosphopentane phosphatase/HAD superfamily hydrolase (TIGR01549 family)
MDFDGTVNRKDVSFNILNHFTEGRWEGIDKEFISGKIGSLTAYSRISKLLKGNENEWKKYSQEMSDIDPWFKKFLEETSDSVEVMIVSDGLDIYIKEILKKEGIYGIEFYANKVEFTGDKIEIKFPFRSEDCDDCGTCKKEVLLKKKKEGYNPIIYVGDGYSDRCVFQYADWVFAKRTLAKILIAKKMGFSYLRSFESLLRWIKEKKRQIIFDLDGTIIDSYKPIIKAMKKALKEMGASPPEDQDLRKMVGIPVNEIMMKFFDSNHDEGVKLFRKFYEKEFRNGTRLIKGVRNVLKELRKDFSLALISNKHERFVKEILKWKKLEKIFDFSAGESECIPPKPSPKMLEMAINSQNLSPKECLFVGDTHIDFITAEKMGVEFVAISTGSEPAESLYELRPSSLITNFSELLKMMRIRRILWK